MQYPRVAGFFLTEKLVHFIFHPLHFESFSDRHRKFLNKSAHNTEYQMIFLLLH